VSRLHLPSPTQPTFYFIGVTTGHSSSRRIFPLWMEALGRPEVIWQGIDLPIHAPAASYRQVVEHIKREPLALGGLVTTHKIDLLEASRDFFDELDACAQLTGEVSSIAKEGDRLVGRATDPVAGGLSLDSILGEEYFARTGGYLLMLGAGGSAAALCLHLIQKANPNDRPRRAIVVNRSQARLDRLARMVARFETDIDFTFVQNADPRHNDELMAELTEGSLIVNATGMGKDSPGSPITSDGLFPTFSVAWELNYRGELDFLRQAQAHQAERQLIVADGWEYFIHGWSQVISHVLHRPIDPPLFARFSALAEAAR